MSLVKCHVVAALFGITFLACSVKPVEDSGSSEQNAQSLSTATVWKICEAESVEVLGSSKVFYSFLLNTQQNSGTLKVSKSKGAAETWGPFKMTYNAPQKWQFIPAGGITIPKFEISGSPVNGFDLVHKVNAKDKLNKNNVDMVFRAKLDCRVAQQAEIVAGSSAVVSAAVQTAAPVSCAWYKIKPGKKLILWSHGSKTDESENDQFMIGLYSVSDVAGPKNVLPTTQLGQTGEQITTATRVHVFIKNSGNMQLNGKKAYVDKDVLDSECGT